MEQGTFTSLVFSTSGGMGRLAQTFDDHLAHLQSIKRQTSNQCSNNGTDLVQNQLYMMRSAILYICGAQSSANHASRACDSIHLAVTEEHLTY